MLLLLLTVGLVVVALAVLIVGLIQHALTLIYVSIGCSAAAAVVLIAFSRLQRRRSLRSAAAVPVGMDLAGDTGADTAGHRPGGSPLGEGEWPAPEAGEGDEDPTTVPAGALPGEEEGWPGDEVSFPIEDYEDLRSSDILPLLGDLDADELLEVRSRELSGQGRRTVLRRVDSLLAGAGVQQRGAASGPGASSLGRGRAGVSEVAGGAAGVAGAPAGVAGGGPAGAPADDAFPIPGYDGLRAADIIPLLAGLDRAQLEQVAARERAGAGRSTVLTRISRLAAAAPGGAAPGSTAEGAPAPEGGGHTRGGDGGRRGSRPGRGKRATNRAPRAAGTGPAPPAETTTAGAGPAFPTAADATAAGSTGADTTGADTTGADLTGGDTTGGDSAATTDGGPATAEGEVPPAASRTRRTPATDERKGPAPSSGPPPAPA